MPTIGAEIRDLHGRAPALVLTAIVISFGVMAFALALAFRAYRVLGNDDLPTWRGSEPPIDAPEDHR